MASYTNMNDNNDHNSYWNSDANFANMQPQPLEFQSFGDMNMEQNYYGAGANMYPSKTTFLEPQADQLYPKIFTPGHLDDESVNRDMGDDDDEPPLLEELEIYPDRIIEKTRAVLNPFHAKRLADDAAFLTQDTDLAGPLLFCLMLAVCLFVSGSSTPFGYIYGISMISCIMMYLLLSLMTINSGIFTFISVASILGYCLLPIVVLAAMRLFLLLHSNSGLILTLFTVLWSSLSASRLFVTISGDDQQRPLIAYPCALVYGVFALLIIF